MPAQPRSRPGSRPRPGLLYTIATGTKDCPSSRLARGASLGGAAQRARAMRKRRGIPSNRVVVSLSLSLPHEEVSLQLRQFQIHGSILSDGLPRLSGRALPLSSSARRVPRTLPSRGRSGRAGVGKEGSEAIGPIWTKAAVSNLYRDISDARRAAAAGQDYRGRHRRPHRRQGQSRGKVK